MELDALLRIARRHLGLSQRAFAELADVPSGTLAAWEAGRRTPTVAVLLEALSRAGLELALAEPPGEADPALVRHLRLTLTARLRLALGENPNLYVHPTSARWRSLELAARTGVAVLDAPVAEALWRPAQPQEGAVPLTVHRARCELPELPGVQLQLSDAPPPVSRIPVQVRWTQAVWVLPPAEFVLLQQRQLRQAAALLERQAARDDAHRRRPAHRDPNSADEAARAMWTATPAAAPRLDGRFSRAWRLDAPASAAQQLRSPGS
jgi:transcriptional regulator with XRE-family HTH domain